MWWSYSFDLSCGVCQRYGSCNHSKKAVVTHAIPCVVASAFFPHNADLSVFIIPTKIKLTHLEDEEILLCKPITEEWLTVYWVLTRT